MNRSRSPTAPTVPQIRPRNWWGLGSVRTARAMTSALSPASARSMRTTLETPIQNDGSKTETVTARRRSGLPGRCGRHRHAPEPAPPRRDDGQHEEEQRDSGDGPRDRPHEEDLERALRHDEALAQGILGEVAQDEREHERGQRIIEFLEHVADHAEDEHIPDVEHAAIDRVGPMLDIWYML